MRRMIEFVMEEGGRKELAIFVITHHTDFDWIRSEKTDTTTVENILTEYTEP